MVASGNFVVVYGGKFQKLLPTEESIKLLRGLVKGLFLNPNEEKHQEVMAFISINLFLNGVDTPFEIKDVYKALKMHKFEYAYYHPFFWSWDKRLMFFVDLNKLVLSKDEKLKSMIISDDLFDDDWRVGLDNRHVAPLKRVLDKYNCGNVSMEELSREENRWVEGGKLICFMKNCFENLTSTHMDEQEGVRCFSYINYMTDNPFYQDVKFFNHLATHFLFPKLWVKLYAAVLDGGYTFLIPGYPC